MPSVYWWPPSYYNCVQHLWGTHKVYFEWINEYQSESGTWLNSKALCHSPQWGMMVNSVPYLLWAFGKKKISEFLWKPGVLGKSNEETQYIWVPCKEAISKDWSAHRQMAFLPKGNSLLAAFMNSDLGERGFQWETFKCWRFLVNHLTYELYSRNLWGLETSRTKTLP